jgi:arylsulfatase A-like enzyme
MKIRNILFLHTHDMGVSNGMYGCRADTPRMEAFAREGTLFRDAHCAAPTCSPSRAALLTGETAHQAGMIGLAHRGFRLARPERHMARVLGDIGFDTAMSGIQHEFDFARDNPYAEVLHDGGDHTRESDMEAAAAAARWLKGRKPGKPFFLWAGFFLPHVRFVWGEGPDGPVRPPSIFPDTAGIRADWSDYLASLACTDHAMGVVLDALTAAGLDGETAVVLTTDHGVPFPEMKCNLTGHGTRISLALRFPGNPMAGRASDALVSHLDVFPTLCELLGTPAPPWLQGHSLLPLLRGETGSIREEIFTEVTYHACYEPMRGVRTPTGNYIRRFDAPRPRRLANCDESRTKREFLARGWGEETLPAEEFYDLRRDPGETCDRIGDPSCEAEIGDLRARLDRWMRETADPLLDGPVPLPPGAVANAIECTDPNRGPFVHGTPP